MPRPRKQLVNSELTPYYHVTARCVRRAMLCGKDPLTGKCYDYRKQWMEDRLRVVSCVFAVKLCTYAIMSNHYHVVIKLTPNIVNSWSMDEVLNRWCVLYKGSLLVQKYRRGETLTELELETLMASAAVYRRRLASLSWFMRSLNEPIARRSNKEDGCTGCFWESRFKSQALFSERALLSCMAYVDLNPVRANIAESPERSAHTGLRERMLPRFNLLSALRKIHGHYHDQIHQLKTEPLIPFRDDRGSSSGDHDSILPLSFQEYLELVNLTGRVSGPVKQASISPKQLSTLSRLSISVGLWNSYCTEFESLYRRGEFGRLST